MAWMRWAAWLRGIMVALVGVSLALCVAVSAPGDAWAGGKRQSVASLIKKGQELFDEQMYEESIQTLSAALMRPGIAKKEKIRVYQLLAYNYITLRRDEEADGAVRGLLVLDEDFELPEGESPRFREFFDEIRVNWIQEGKPGLEKAKAAASAASRVQLKHASPAQVEAGLDVSLTGKVDDPNARVDKIVLHYRTGSSGKYVSGKVKFAMRKFSAEIPGEAVEPPLVEYYLEALDESGLPVAARGDAASPLRIAVPDETSWYASPWFWVPVGVVVVGAIVVTAVVITTTAEEGTASVTVNVFE